MLPLILRYFKQQDWYMAPFCILFFCLFHIFDDYLLSILFFALLFLAFYTTKYFLKKHKQPIDKIKLLFYFVYVIAYLWGEKVYGLRDILLQTLPFALSLLYLYSILFFSHSKMETENKKIPKSIWVTIVSAQGIFILMLIVWGFTQKAEADKQKDDSRRYQEDFLQERKKYDDFFEISRNQIETQEKIADKAQQEALMYKEKYEALLNKKK